ncbi:sensor histidine kinase [Anaerostipes sp.]|uniref:sensor histidine kinase n=1 Tax=Anaerostipes sp. TaxID=1872530 RepID=UPI0025C39080|nr:HAMP domain-containing sensor histidine kinase [Anaerostipes sp.]MBS7009307.1 HAMP domain-containing histidine kinase [Anaerostipes sp.]
MILILSAGIVILTGYLILLRKQINKMNRQLDKRRKENTRQPISLELMDSGLTCLAANINQCLKSEEKLKEQSIRKEQEQKDMIANLSHDLRTPLTAIKGYQQLLMKTLTQEDQKDRLRIAQKHADELGNLIEQFFEYSLLASKASEPDWDRINLGALIAECIAEMIPVLEEKELRIRMEEQEIVYVRADRKMLIRMIQNLIRNCLAYAESDVTVKVEKTEKGIFSFGNKSGEKADTDRLFERFYREDRARGQSGGLGLSIVKLLSEQMGGTAKASWTDGWLVIRVELPLYCPE